MKWVRVSIKLKKYLMKYQKHSLIMSRKIRKMKIVMKKVNKAKLKKINKLKKKNYIMKMKYAMIKKKKRMNRAKRIVLMKAMMIVKKLLNRIKTER